MQLAFYWSKTGTWYDKLVDLCSGGRGFSHVEIHFGNGTCFSSSPRDGGCRFRLIDMDDHWDLVDLPFSAYEENRIIDICRSYCRPRRYVFYQKLACIAVNLHRTHHFCGRKHGYDWVGVFRFIFPWLPIKLSRHRRFCSEVCVQACQFRWSERWMTDTEQAHFNYPFEGIDARKISPNGLYRLACQINGAFLHDEQS